MIDMIIDAVVGLLFAFLVAVGVLGALESYMEGQRRRQVMRNLLAPQFVDTSDSCVMGTVHYIAPERLLAAGFTAESMAAMAVLTDDWPDWESSFYPGDEISDSQPRWSV